MSIINSFTICKLKVKRQEQINHTNINQRKADVDTIVSDEGDFGM